MKMYFLIPYFLLSPVLSLPVDSINVSLDYFKYKGVKHLVYLSCCVPTDKYFVKSLMLEDKRISVKQINRAPNDLEESLIYKNTFVGVILDGTCTKADNVLKEASRASLFDSSHMWLVLNYTKDVNSTKPNLNVFQKLNLSVDTDLILASFLGDRYELIDVFNFGKIQGNDLEKNFFGTWSRENGLSVSLSRFKYYDRWDFHNLTLRAVSVMLDRPKTFKSEMLTEPNYSPSVALMTKITSRLLNILKKIHNFSIVCWTAGRLDRWNACCTSYQVPPATIFKPESINCYVLRELIVYRVTWSKCRMALSLMFNYTITDRWLGSTARNSAMAVSNSLYWREQDIASTCVRVFPQRLDWFDIFHPPTTRVDLLEMTISSRGSYSRSKFYYLIPTPGVGDFENRFLTPLSPTVWYCAGVFGVIFVMVLSIAGAVEDRPQFGHYAVFSVLAAIAQQTYEDGVQLVNEAFSSQSRRLILLIIGLTSMLLYNYYTSSVVSWLLNAAIPTLDSLDGLINSDLELVFEDTGYTRGWLVNPGFYYYSGFKNTKEDELREKKGKLAKRSAKLMLPVTEGIQLVRSGGYAYHTEPYVAYQVISRTFDDEELCNLGALQMMKPAPVYIMAQKQSPYRNFFIWSLMRLLERGHISAANTREGTFTPTCSGSSPRALALGQAAPAFAFLALSTLLSLFILYMEILWYRLATKNYRTQLKPRKVHCRNNSGEA